MTAGASELMSSLYALRAQAGAVRTHAERQRRLSVAARMAAFQCEVSEEIEKLASGPANAPALPPPQPQPDFAASCHFPDPT